MGPQVAEFIMLSSLKLLTSVAFLSFCSLLFMALKPQKLFVATKIRTFDDHRQMLDHKINANGREQFNLSKLQKSQIFF